MAIGAVFQDIRPGAGFKTGDFVKEKLGCLPYNKSLTDRVVHPMSSTPVRKRLAQNVKPLRVDAPKFPVSLSFSYPLGGQDIARKQRFGSLSDWQFDAVCFWPQTARTSCR